MSCTPNSTVIRFPYEDVEPLAIDAKLSVDFFDLPQGIPDADEDEIISRALASPIGTANLEHLSRGKHRVLIVVDDVTRPTPVRRFVHKILESIHAAGVEKHKITFITSLGTHRPMTRKEMAAKLGEKVVEEYRCENHNWRDPDSLEYLGETEQGIPVWINKIVRQSDLVIGIGSIMPIDICGYTGGGKILVPGLSGPETVNKMHWNRIDVPSSRVIGHRDNTIRHSIDALARKAGLDFVLDVITDANERILDAVAGDMVEAHRNGCRRAAKRFKVQFEKEYDIVVSDSYPFGIEFWQANKALDMAAHFVKKGGVIILIAPCPEGWSRTHKEEILKFGYRRISDIKSLVANGEIKHSVVGVHMYQVSEAAVEKGRLILVSGGLPEEEVTRVGFMWSRTPEAAFLRALELVPPEPDIAVVRNAARMIPVPTGEAASPAI